MEYKDFYWANTDSIKFLTEGYLREGVTVEQRIEEMANEAKRYLGDHPYFHDFVEKFKLYMKKGWISPSSPIWSNLGAGRALSIACNGSYIPDSVSGILDKCSEIGMMTKGGAGTSAYFGDIRPRGTNIGSGGKSDGVVRFLEMFDKVTNVISQNSVRRGSFAAYLPIEHGDFYDFMEIREHGHPIQKMSLGVCISDEFMMNLQYSNSPDRKRWIRLLEKRFNSGYPYLFFTDNANNQAPQVYKDKGKRIYASNLCNEIALSSDKDESFVCCLSSLNLLHYDEWKDTDLVEVVTFFLDAVIEDYIQKTANMAHMAAAHNFAKNQRAIGIGVLGWHSYLQRNMIPFESLTAKTLNLRIFKDISEKSLAATKKLAVALGEPELLKGYGERNVTRMAVAPTTSSSFILGQVSPSIEPLRDNYFVKNLAKGAFSYKNPFLEQLLTEKGKNERIVWRSILENGGSVQHLEFLSSEEKDVFKTFSEISPYEIILQASIRQKFIDQGQSVNVLIPHDANVKQVSDLMIKAWELGLKGLYYQRSTNPSAETARNILQCKSCES